MLDLFLVRLATTHQSTASSTNHQTHTKSLQKTVSRSATTSLTDFAERRREYLVATAEPLSSQYKV